jgi:hypothetical protein
MNRIAARHDDVTTIDQWRVRGKRRMTQQEIWPEEFASTTGETLHRQKFLLNKFGLDPQGPQT